MSSGYSKIITFNVTCGVPTAVELPAPPRGMLERVILTQVGGDHGEAATCNIYDRKGACKVANDLNVAKSGSFNSYDSAEGAMRIYLDEPSNLIVGDKIQLKGFSDLAYDNVPATVVDIVNAAPSYSVVLDLTYSDTLSLEFGRWQSIPFNPTTQPVTHLVYTFNKLDDEDYVAFDVQRSYENKDNQDIAMRTRNSALWLEVLTVGAAEQFTFQIAYTCRADTIV